jgi:hypothetical protein
LTNVSQEAVILKILFLPHIKCLASQKRYRYRFYRYRYERSSNRAKTYRDPSFYRRQISNGSLECVKKLSNPKFRTFTISVADPGCFIPDPGSDHCSIPDPDPGSGGYKSTGSRIRPFFCIKAINKFFCLSRIPDPDPTIAPSRIPDPG